MRVDRDAGVEGGYVAAGGFGFGQGVEGVGLVEEDLALEVRGFDEVAVDEGERGDTGAGEQAGGCGARGPDSNDSGVSGTEFLLAFGADAGEEDLAGVALGVGDGWGVRH